MGILETGISLTETAKLLRISVEEVELLKKQELLSVMHIDKGMEFFSATDVARMKSHKGLTLSQEAEQVASQLQRDTSSSLSLFLKVILVSILVFLIYVFIIVVLL